MCFVNGIFDVLILSTFQDIVLQLTIHIFDYYLIVGFELIQWLQVGNMIIPSPVVATVV